MTIYRAKMPIEVETSPGVTITIAYGDLVDLPQHIIDSLLAENMLDWTDVALPVNDPTHPEPKGDA
jgi:hypothetical protein